MAKGKAPRRPAPTGHYFKELAGKAEQQPALEQMQRGTEVARAATGVELADRERDALNRYQQEHQMQIAAGRPVGGVTFSRDGRQLVTASDDSQIMLWDANANRYQQGIALGAVPAARGAGVTAPAQAGLLPAGLASLDVELPRRGVVYRFTTPKGDVEITARAVSRELTERTGQAVLAAVIFLVILWFVWLVRRGRFQWLTGRVGSWCLIAVGLLLLCILPLLGLVAVCGGVTAKLRRVAARQVAP
jgi:hypothetical protein